MEVLEAALNYLRRGWSVIPVDGDTKRPMLKHWSPFQAVAATEEQVHKWYEQWPNAGVAIITGRISGIFVFDIDPRNGGNESLQTMLDNGELTPEELARAPRVRTQGGGVHYYYKYPEGKTVKMKPGFRPGLDLKSDGGYCVAPPTIAPGTKRGWVWET